MSQDGVFLVRGASPKVVLSVLENTPDLQWYSDMELDADDTKSKPGVLLAVPDYFPSDASELELYRKRLLGILTPEGLAKLHGDPRGVFVFDPVMAESKNAFSFDEIVEVCSEHIGVTGLWFDPTRPIAEQNLPFEAVESIPLTREMVEGIVRAGRKAAAQKASNKPAAKKAAKKPVAKKAAKPAAKRPSSKKPAAKKPAAKKPAAKKPAAKKPAAKKSARKIRR